MSETSRNLPAALKGLLIFLAVASTVAAVVVIYSITQLLGPSELSSKTAMITQELKEYREEIEKARQAKEKRSGDQTDSSALDKQIESARKRVNQLEVEQEQMRADYQRRNRWYATVIGSIFAAIALLVPMTTLATQIVTLYVFVWEKPTLVRIEAEKE